MAPVIPCNGQPSITKVVPKPEIESEKNFRTMYSCIVESHESTRQRAESSQSKKGCTSMTHYNWVHKVVPMPQAMKIPDAMAAVDKEWKKLETIPAWDLESVKSKNKVILEAQRDTKKVHFATLMHICHVKNAELEPTCQKYKGRVVLRGDIVKDDSGAYAVFTEQGSCTSQMTDAKIMDVIARLPACDGPSS